MKSIRQVLRCMLFLFLCSSLQTQGQNIAITDDDGYTAKPSAMLDVKSLTKGMLVPRLTTTQQNAISSPETGLLIFNTTENKFSFYDGSSWQIVGSNVTFTNGLTQIGDQVGFGGSLTSGTALYLGDNYLRFEMNGTGNFNVRDNGTSAFFVSSNTGNVGIGTTVPGQKLVVDGNIQLGNNIMVEGNPNYRVYRNLATAEVSTHTGYIVIRTNQPMASCMFTMKIDGYFYNNDGTDGPYDIFLKAYMNTTDFRYMGYTSLSPHVFPIQLAKDPTGNMAVIIGEASTDYSYPKFTVSHFTQGHGNIDPAYADDWSIEFISDLTGYSEMEDVPRVSTIDLDDYYSSSEVDGLIDAIDYFNKSGSNISPEYTTDNLGLGTNTPAGKLEVRGTSVDLETPIFEVKNAQDQTVFAVYPEGVRVYVNDNPQSKAIGNKGGFAVGGFSSVKGYTDDYFIVSRDSSRLYYDPNASKASGNKGGFAVGGFSSVKGDPINFMDLSVENYFIGHEGGLSITSGQYNTSLGYQAGKYTTEALYNVFIGYRTGRDHTTGYGNSFVGSMSGMNNETADYNSFFGYKSGFYNTVGSYNTFLGYMSGQYNKEGEYNTYIGFKSGYESGWTAGNKADFNTMIGYQSGYNNRNGDKNVFLGYYAGYKNNDASNNTFIGTESGYNNLEGFKNVFIGYRSGYTNNSGEKNVFIGNNAGYSNYSGDRIICIGDSAGSHNTASNNIFIGSGCGRSNTSGNNNLFVGNDAGAGNETGVGNTYLGWGAGVNNDGDNNVMIGYWTGIFQNTGNNNLFLGQGAGLTNEGSDNIFLGYLANGAGNNNIIIGNQIDADGNELVIEGSGDNSSPLIKGNFSSNYLNFNAKVATYSNTPETWFHINKSNDAHLGDGSGVFQIGSQDGTNLLMDNNEIMARSNGSTSTLYLQWSGGNVNIGNGSHGYYGSWSNLSDRRMKKDIKNLDYGLNEILKLRPVEFYWKDSTMNGKYLGLLAQEVELILGEVVNSFSEGEYLSVDYISIVPVLINAIKEQQNQIEKINAQISNNETAIDEFKAMLKQKDLEIQSLKTQNEDIEKQIQHIKSALNLETKK